jgi:hypothetical protein
MDTPARESVTQNFEPLANASFAGMDFLPAADEADDYRPILMPVEVRNQEFGLRRVESGDFLPALHEISRLIPIPGTLRFVEDYNVVKRWLRSTHTFIAEVVDILDEGLNRLSNDPLAHTVRYASGFITNECLLQHRD